MKNIKKTIITIALILVLTISIFIICLPAVSAQDVQPNAFLAVNPNPVGVNQQAFIVVWLQPVTPDPSEVFFDFAVMVTKPDGNIDTLRQGCAERIEHSA